MRETTPDRAEEQLDALSEAARAITSELSLDRVLKRLAEIAANLVDARYAALGVPDGQGGFEQFHTYGMTDDEIAQMDHYPRGTGLLGVLLTETETIRLDDIRRDPRAAGFCPYHPPMTRFLGVPIISKGKHLGSLYLTDRRDGQPFSETDQRMIELLAAHAAVAIENARLSEQLQKLAVIEERDRIGMELHDGIIQAIYAVGMKLEFTRLTLVKEQAAAEQIASANNDLNRVIEDLRNYVQDLRGSVDYTVSFHEQLDEIAESFRQVSPAKLIISAPRTLTRITEDRLHGIIQIVREALSNAVRHANASEIRIELRETASEIVLIVADNGKGFAPGRVKVGSGLPNIRLRVRNMGGKVDFASHPGQGVTVTVVLPL
jgi:nitrate/nitrite-specific signal transduction histidine kinase